MILPQYGYCGAKVYAQGSLRPALQRRGASGIKKKKAVSYRVVQVVAQQLMLTSDLSYVSLLVYPLIEL